MRPQRRLACNCSTKIGDLARNTTSIRQGLLEEVQRRLPDATADDIAHWRDDKQLDFRVIDDKLLYFNRKPQKICLSILRTQKAIESTRR